LKRKLALLLIIIILPIPLLASPSPYCILISLDGFRWDYANRGITPNLEQIRSEGVAALSLKPSFPTSTFPNHYSIITGLKPQNHGLILNYFENNDKEIFKLSDTNAVRNPKWYWGEAFWETARRYGIITASYYWPGSELLPDYRRPNYFKPYHHNEPHSDKIEGVINWLSLPFNERPRFITLYFHDSDSDGHNFGTDSKEINATIFTLDSLIGIIRKRIEQIGMKDSVNLIIVSDHGMTNVSDDRTIDLASFLKGFDCKVNDMSAFAMIEPNNPNQLDEIYSILKKNEKNYKVYLRDEMPLYYSFSAHPNIFSLLVVPEIGWSIRYRERRYISKAEHGYDNNHTDMHGIFFAVGNKFKKNYPVGTLNNIDIYPLLCKMFGIYPRMNIDGNAENIIYILNK